MSSSDHASTAASTQSIRAKLDPTWEHCTQIPNKKEGGKSRLKCLYCAKEFAGGGINRMKQHLAGKRGDAISCKNVPRDIRFRLEENLKEIEGKRTKKQDYPTKTEDSLFRGNDSNMEEMAPPQSQERVIEANVPSSSQLRKRKASESLEKFYAQGQSRVHNQNKKCIYAIAAIGPDYKVPNYHAVRSKILQDMKKEVQLLVDECRSFWAETGCTIMADDWQDQKNRQLINFLIYCPRRIVFIKSVDASDIVKDAQNLCNLFMDMVAFAGANNIVNLVTDNAANYKAAGRLLNDKYPSIFWSSCAAHCLNLILADIDDQQRVNVVEGEGIDLGSFSQEDDDSYNSDVDAFEPNHAWINQVD
ncbi:uncharacterized protein LOC129322470 [Prosopis cineraria]|uniref:uncharacterized protein LOC129322470 n=1 Tax=Prosopis cineraria TaxID=364024 RepID=UPI00240ED12F|nr:uncharacterized protein LOC129322470 [Prosopis cineraria]